MKKIIFLLAIIAVVLTSCVETKSESEVYYTVSTFYYKVPNDLFKFADVKVCAIYPDLSGTKIMTAEQNLFKDTVVVFGSFEQIAYGYHIYVEAKEVDSIAKQDVYALDYEVNNQFGEMLYTGEFESLSNDVDRGTQTYTYDELVKNLDKIVSDYNDKHQYYYRWTETADKKYSVSKVK